MLVTPPSLSNANAAAAAAGISKESIGFLWVLVGPCVDVGHI